MKTVWLSPLVLDQCFSVQFRADNVRIEFDKARLEILRTGKVFDLH